MCWKGCPNVVGTAACVRFENLEFCPSRSIESLYRQMCMRKAICERPSTSSSVELLPPSLPSAPSTKTPRYRLGGHPLYIQPIQPNLSLHTFMLSSSPSLPPPRHRHCPKGGRVLPNADSFPAFFLLAAWCACVFACLLFLASSGGMECNGVEWNGVERSESDCLIRHIPARDVQAC